MRIDLNMLSKLEKEKLVRREQHPSFPLSVANYTELAQYSRAWDKYPFLLQCRGIIFHSETGEIVAKNFPKFFNLGEPGATVPELPNETPEISVKLDGSLGTQFFWEGQWHIATRGSFVSEQARKATAILREKYGERDFLPNFTYLWEIVYPGNRIIVDYSGVEDLFLIGAINYRTGQEMGYGEVIKEAQRLKVPTTDLLESGSWQDLTQLKKKNFEGWVLRFPSTGQRVKVKLPDYVELHRLVTGLSVHRVWQGGMEENYMEELLSQAPDEVYAFIQITMASLKDQAEKLHQEVVDITQEAQAKFPNERKEQAKWLLENHRSVSSLVFKALDGRDFQSLLWRAIEPKTETEVAFGWKKGPDIEGI